MDITLPLGCVTLGIVLIFGVQLTNSENADPFLHTSSFYVLKARRN